MNFVFARLCDNDFGWTMSEALGYIWKHKEGDLTPEDLQYFVIEYVLRSKVLRRIAPGARVLAEDLEITRQYLTVHLRVSYERHVPVMDHDGGSAVLDMHSGRTWTI